MLDGPGARIYRQSDCPRPSRQGIGKLSPAWWRLRRRRSVRLRSCRWIETSRTLGHLSHARFRGLFLDLDLYLLQGHASWTGPLIVAAVLFLGPLPEQ